MKKSPTMRVDGTVAYTPISHEVLPKEALKVMREIKQNPKLRTAFLKKSGIFGSDGKLNKAYASDCPHLY